MKKLRGYKIKQHKFWMCSIWKFWKIIQSLSSQSKQYALMWNSLSPSIVDFRSFSSFKRTNSNAHV